MDATQQNTEVEIMGRAVSSGQSLRSVASSAGVSPTTVLRRLIRAGDPFQRRRHRPLLSEERCRIIRLAEEGETSVRRIAITVGRGNSWHSVRRVLEAEGLPRIAKPHRCEHCGYLVTVQPCMVCQALAAREKAIHATTS